jgi:hypothetical protein
MSSTVLYMSMPSTDSSRGAHGGVACYRVLPRTPILGTSVNKPPGNTPDSSGWHHRRC